MYVYYIHVLLSLFPTRGEGWLERLHIKAKDRDPNISALNTQAACAHPALWPCLHGRSPGTPMPPAGVSAWVSQHCDRTCQGTGQACSKSTRGYITNRLKRGICYHTLVYVYVSWVPREQKLVESDKCCADVLGLPHVRKQLSVDLFQGGCYARRMSVLQSTAVDTHGHAYLQPSWQIVGFLPWT